MEKKLIDAIHSNPNLTIQIPRRYGYALYEHDEENGDTRIGPFRFRRIGGYGGTPWENVLIDDEHILEGTVDAMKGLLNEWQGI